MLTTRPPDQPAHRPSGHAPAIRPHLTPAISPLTATWPPGHTSGHGPNKIYPPNKDPFFILAVYLFNLLILVLVNMPIV